MTIFINKPDGYVPILAFVIYIFSTSLITPQRQFDRNKNAFSPQHIKGLAPAGRLDIDSQGLLVLTQDGRIARQLIGEDSEVEKEYLVRVEGTIGDNGLRLLNYGLSLDGEQLKPAEVSWQNEDQL